LGPARVSTLRPLFLPAELPDRTVAAILPVPESMPPRPSRVESCRAPGSILLSLIGLPCSSFWPVGRTAAFFNLERLDTHPANAHASRDDAGQCRLGL